MAGFLGNVYAFFATLPFFSFIIIYIIAVIKTKDKKESLKWAIHITMILLLSSVSVMMKEATGSRAGFWWMILLLIAIGGLVSWLQWKIRASIDVKKIMRAVWTLGFGVFSLAYVILFISLIVINYTNA